MKKECKWACLASLVLFHTLVLSEVFMNPFLSTFLPIIGSEGWAFVTL